MLHLRTKKTLMSVAVASACGLLAMPAWTQEAAKNSDANKEQIAEVQVSATRHSTSLLQTPVAVTAITQESLTRSGITDVRGLTGAVPNLQISTGADSGVQMAIRGVSSNNFTEIGDPAVGLHVGGLYSPRPQGAMALMFDLEQVEVLRGPQGTLFGRNSTAGSVNIIPAKPEFGSSYGSTELDIGSYNQRQINLVQNIGVNDSLALRATFMKVKRDGWINQTQDFTDVDNPDHGFHADGIPDVDQRQNRKVDKANFYNNKDEWAGRLSARWAVSKDLEWTLSYEKFQNSGAGDISLKDCDQAAGTRFACTGGKWDAKVNVPGMIDMSIDTLRSNVIWNLNKNSKIEYGYAHAIQQRKQQSDDDAGYHPLASQVTAQLPVAADASDQAIWHVNDNTSRTLDSKYVSDVHELQFKQNFDTLQYVAGAFWMHEKNQINYAQEQLVTAPFGFPTSQYYQQPDRQIDAKALYAQADWKFAPSWTATIGGRYSWDSKTDKGGTVYGGWDGSNPAYYNNLYQPGTPGDANFRAHNGTDLTTGMGPLAGTGAYAAYGAPAQNDHSESWKHFTYRLGLMTQITPTDMVYTSLSTGYKSGGFGDRDDICGEHTCVTGPVGPQYSFFPYKPETVTNLELGYKGKFLENRLSLAATVFYSKYKGMQVTGNYFASRIITDGPCPADKPGCAIVEKWQTTNVGVVDIPGLELEMDYKPWKGARLGGFFSYINSKITDYPSYSDTWNCGVRAETGAVPCPEAYTGSNANLAGRQIYDITGNHLPLAPKYTFGLNFSQNFVLENNYVIVPWISMKWQDKMYFTLRNLDNPHISDAQAAFTKVDASIKLIAPKNWHIEAYVLNLTNSMTKNSVTDGGGFVKATWNDPRVYGVRVGIDY
jgi:iron complex outermembrane receptor protein